MVLPVGDHPPANDRALSTRLPNTNMPNEFTHLHVHTEYSMLDGLGGVQQYVDRAVEHGMSALAITDHGVLCGLPEFYHACRKAGIEPILGSEFYFVEDVDEKPTNKKGETKERHHVVILARGQRGYQVLSELSTATHQQFHYKPLLDRDLVEQLGDDAQHLVVLSGCAASIISHTARDGDMRSASWWTAWWRDMFPHFYIELQDHGTEFDRPLNKKLLKLARKYNLPWVITNDPHYVVPEDEQFHDTLLAIQTASDVDAPDRFRFDGTGYHLKSRKEMFRQFKSYGAEVWKPGVAATNEIAELCVGRIPQWEKRHWHIPKFPDVPDSYKELKRLSFEGLRERGLERDDTYRARTVQELKAFKKVGISDFLMITQDVIQWARLQGIPVGPGRGSVCGSLVGYLVGIHKMDPVRYDLMFERFLNPARPRMPDIDTDFGPTRRSEVFDYVIDKYGEENVVHVCTYGRMRVKAAFKSLSKAYGVGFVESNRLSKMLPDELPAEEGGGDDDSVPQEFWDAIAEYPELYKTLQRLAGVKRSVGAHPAGIIIADKADDIRKLVPQLWLASGKQMCGQYDLEAAEEMGLMKEDFLSLRTLETIQEAVDLIAETTGEKLDPDSWVPDEEPGDDAVYAMLARGETAGVFQMEGPTNQRGIKAIGCERFEDIVSCTSLYRTGAISAGFPKMFIENRRSGHISYLHPKLKPILGHTWGVVLYQEQVMEMGAALAGFDMVQVDDIKEAIKHKKSTLMQSMKPLFVKGCRKNSGMSRQVAEQVWHMIEGYSGYGYNRSHAVAYTFTTYQTARLKALWPAQFIVALLRTVKKDKAGKVKHQRYLSDALRIGLTIQPPDINRSGLLPSLDDNAKAIRFGFTDISGIGLKQAQKIIDGRPRKGYKTVEQVEAAVRNKGVLKALAEAGALQRLGVEADPKRMSELLSWAFYDPMEKYRGKYGAKLLLPADSFDGEHCVLVGEITSVEHRTSKHKTPFIIWHVRWDATNEWNVMLWSSVMENDRKRVWSLGVGSVVQVTGKWSSKYENVGVASCSAVKVIRRAKHPL